MCFKKNSKLRKIGQVCSSSRIPPVPCQVPQLSWKSLIAVGWGPWLHFPLLLHDSVFCCIFSIHKKGKSYKKLFTLFTLSTRFTLFTLCSLCTIFTPFHFLYFYFFTSFALYANLTVSTRFISVHSTCNDVPREHFISGAVEWAAVSLWIIHVVLFSSEQTDSVEIKR